MSGATPMTSIPATPSPQDASVVMTGNRVHYSATATSTPVRTQSSVPKGGGFSVDEKIREWQKRYSNMATEKLVPIRST